MLAAVLAGVAVSIKSLFVAPPLLAALVLVRRRHGVRAAAALVGGAAAVAVLLAVPWGVGEVWHQYVELHLDAASEHRRRRERRVRVGAGAARERLLLAAGALAVVAAVARRRRRPDADGLVVGDLDLVRRRRRARPRARAPVRPAPDRARRSRRAARRPLPPAGRGARLVAGLLLAVSHGRGAEWRRTSPEPTPSEAAAVDLLRRIEPADAPVVTDEPALAWIAGRRIPGPLVDPSHVRIDAGHLTVDEVVDGHRGVRAPARCCCGPAASTSLPGLEARLDDFRPELTEAGTASSSTSALRPEGWTTVGIPPGAARRYRFGNGSWGWT